MVRWSIKTIEQQKLQVFKGRFKKSYNTLRPLNYYTNRHILVENKQERVYLVSNEYQTISVPLLLQMSLFPFLFLTHRGIYTHFYWVGLFFFCLSLIQPTDPEGQIGPCGLLSQVSLLVFVWGGVGLIDQGYHQLWIKITKCDERLLINVFINILFFDNYV